jgi:hypothetical protein
MLARMLQRRGTAAQWADVANTVILAPGEIGLETDTGKFKVGDGNTVWNQLSYYLRDSDNIEIYSKLVATQTFIGTQTFQPANASSVPFEVRGVDSQNAKLQRWRVGIGAPTEVASIDATGKLTANGASFVNNVQMNANTITGLSTPAQPSAAATKEYVDEVAQGLSVKPAVEAATTTNLTATYDNGNNGIDSTLTLPPSATLVLDGWSDWQLMDGVLVKDQTNKAHNGRYFISQLGDATTPWILNRCPACDEPEEIPSSYVFVQHGDVYENTGWVASVEDTSAFQVGVDTITWVQFSGAGTYTAGAGLTLSGPAFAVGQGDGIQVNPDSIQIASGGVTSSMIANGTIVNEDVSDTAAIAATKINGTAVTQADTGTVATGMIANNAVTNDKLATDSVSNLNLQDNSVGTNEIQNGAVTSNKIADNTIVDGDVNSSAAIAQSKIANLVGDLANKSDVNHTHPLGQLSDVDIIGTPSIRQVLKYDGTSWINELPSGGISVGTTPPPEAAEGDAWFDSTDGSLYVYYDDGVGSLSRTNLIPNPSFETNLDGWQVLTGDVSVTRDTSEFFSGNASAKIVGFDFLVSVGYSNASGQGAILVTPNQQYTFSIFAKTESGTFDNFNLLFRWHNSSNSFLSETSASSITINSSTWTRHSITATAPENAAYVVPVINADSYFSPFFVDAAMLEQSSTLGSYIEGTTPAGSSAQWVQVKANSALEASILTRLSAVEARIPRLEQVTAIRVLSQAQRDALFPSPTQGNAVFRADLGYEQQYFEAFDPVEVPDGTTGTPGWYKKINPLEIVPAKTGAYTVASGDEDTLIELNGTFTVSIPTDATFNFLVGAEINLLNIGTGAITVAAVTPGTTTVNGTPGLKLRAQWSSATLIKRAPNTWVVIGDLVP